MEQREKLIELLRDCYGINAIPTADYLLANGVVLPCRCKDCEHNKENENYRFCEVNQRMIDRYGYCQHAKQKGGDE